MFVSIITWILVGLAAGFLVGVIFPDTRRHVAGTVSAGIMGAIVGGVLYNAFQIGSMSSLFGATSIIFAAISSVAFLSLIYIVSKPELK